MSLICILITWMFIVQTQHLRQLAFYHQPRLLEVKEAIAVNQLLSDLGLPRQIRSLRSTEILKSMGHDMIADKDQTGKKEENNS